jgi:hypothetical protein
VTWSKDKKKWFALMKINKKLITIKKTNNEKEAAIARNEYIILNKLNKELNKI